MPTKPHSHRKADAARRKKKPSKGSSKKIQTRKKNRVAQAPVRATSAPSTLPGSKPDEMERTIAFRLSADERDVLQSGKKQRGVDVSVALRSLLITQLLIGRDRISSVTFIGGFRAHQPSPGRKWQVTDADGKTMHRDLDRDEAIVRCEWAAQVATGTVSADDLTRLKKTIAFRLSTEEHTALTRLKTINDTTLSAVLRSFLTTQLVQGHSRLLAVSFGKDHRAYQSPDNKTWCVSNGDGKVIACNLSREDAMQRADWDAQAENAA